MWHDGRETEMNSGCKSPGPGAWGVAAVVGDTSLKLSISFERDGRTHAWTMPSTLAPLFPGVTGAGARQEWLSNPLFAASLLLIQSHGPIIPLGQKGRSALSLHQRLQVNCESKRRRNKQ